MLTVALAGQVLQEHLGTTGWRVRSPEEGWSGTSFFAERDTDRVFLKFRVSIPLLQRLAQLEVAPPVLESGTRDGDSFVIQRYIDGRYPDRRWFDDHLPDLASLLRTYQEDRSLQALLRRDPGAGYWNHIRRHLEELEQRLERASHRFRAADLLEGFAQFRDQAQQLETAPLAATHGDVSRKNFLLTNDRTYLVDWDEAELADPMRDVGPLLWWYVPRGHWVDFFEAAGEGVSGRGLDRLNWWVAEESLDIALALDEKGYREDVPDFIQDFQAALRQDVNPHARADASRHKD